MEDSAIRQSLLRQYRAGLDMLRKAVDLCPENLWLSTDYRNRYWHIAYHSLFYTHFYVQPSEGDFLPWSKHVPNSNYLCIGSQANSETFHIPEPYTKLDVQEYWEVCVAEVEKQVPLIRLEDTSGFSWLPFHKVELQFYNIRHLQHHTGQLIDRLRTAADVGVSWVRSR